MIKINNWVFKTHSALTFGDYGGAGSVGLSNINIVKNEAANIIQTTYRVVEHIRKANEAGITGSEILWGGIAYILGEEEDFDETLPDALLLEGTVYVRTTNSDWGTSIISQLDDEGVSHIEAEWESEAWDNWLRSDLIRTLPEQLRDHAEDLEDSTLFEYYHEAMEIAIPEHNHVFVRVERIAAPFRVLIADHFGG